MQSLQRCWPPPRHTAVAGETGGCLRQEQEQQQQQLKKHWQRFWLTPLPANPMAARQRVGEQRGCLGPQQQLQQHPQTLLMGSWQHFLQICLPASSAAAVSAGAAGAPRAQEQQQQLHQLLLIQSWQHCLRHPVTLGQLLTLRRLMLL